MAVKPGKIAQDVASPQALGAAAGVLAHGVAWPMVGGPVVGFLMGQFNLDARTAGTMADALGAGVGAFIYGQYAGAVRSFGLGMAASGIVAVAQDLGITDAIQGMVPASASGGLPAPVPA